MKVKGIAKLLSAVMAMTCISFPAVSHAEDTTSTEVTSSLKEEMFVNSNESDYINTFAYGIGYASQYMDYDNYNGSTFADGVWSAEINDNTLDASALVARPKGWNGAGIMANPSTGADNMIEQASGWGYRGFVLRSEIDNNPHTAGVIDARSYADNGAISYDINVDGQDINDVYLTVGYYSSLIDLGWYWEGDMEKTFSYTSSYLDAEKLDEMKAPNGKEATWRRGTVNYQRIRFAGVPLKDYYDAEKGGFQRITVPFSAFTNNSSFNKYAGKSTGTKDIITSADHDKTFNPAMIRTVGIARKDSGTKAVNFTSKIKDVAIVATSAPANFTATANDSGKVQLSWDDVNDDVTYQIKKTVDGDVTYIDVPEGQTDYLDEDVDTTNTEIEVKYSVIAINATYNTSASTDEVVFNKPVETTALKQRLFVNGNWSDYINTYAYAIGSDNTYLDYDNTSGSTFENRVWTTYINDNTLTENQLVTRAEGTSGAGIIGNPKTGADNMIEPSTGWGYRGFMPFWDPKKTGNIFPAQVIDAREYADNGAISYIINVEGQNLDGVYLAVGYYKNLWDLGWYWEGDMEKTFPYGSTYIDAEKLDAIKAPNGTAATWRNGAGNYRAISFAGVPLKDYYDTAKGGFQTITIPFSEFTNNSSFNKYASKQTLSSEDHANTFNPAMIRTAGIARMDAKNKVEFTSQIKDVAIVAPTAAKNVKAEKTANGAKVSWKRSTDTDVKQILVKEINRQKQYIDVTGSEYLDTNIGAEDEAVYYVITKDTAYGAEAVSEKFYYNAPETQSELVSDMQVGKEKEVGTGKDTSGNLTDTVSSHWYTGTKVNVWGEYEDYWGAQVTGSGENRRADYWLVDSNYVYDDSVEATNKNKGKILDNVQFTDDKGNDHGLVSHEYGLGGFEYNENLGTIKDMSAHKGGYLVMDVSFQEPNGKAVNLDGSYFTVEFAKSGEEIQNHVNGKPNYGKGRVYNAIVRGVPVKDYYDTTIGGYQRVAIPLSAFTNAAEPEMKYVKTREGSFASLLAADNTNDYDFAKYMHMFKGAGVARKNFKNASGIKYSIKNMYIVDTAAPRELSAAYTSSGVTLTWKDAAVENVSKYAIYRDGRRLTVVDGVSYTDTTVRGGDHTYEVKTVSPTYDNVLSAAATAQITVPTTSSIAIYAGTGDAKTETKYTKAGTMEADLMAVATGTRGYAALYDADGVLKSVKTVALGSATAQSIKFDNVLATDTLKAFIWNSDMTPECDEAVATPKGTTVLVIGDEVAAQAVDYLDEIGAAAGKALNVTSVYANGATMNNHYTNIAKDNVVYTKSVNGTVSADLVSLNDVIGEGDWDYVILQDNSIYDGIDAYYAAGTGAAYTEIPVVVAKIREASPAAKIYASQPTGFDDAFYEAQSDNFKAYIDEVVGNEDFFNTSSFITSLSAGGIVPAVDSTADIIGAYYIDSHDQMTSTYEGSAVFVNGKNLTEDGKFFTAAYIYRVLANGANVTNAFVPAGVTDAEGILATING